MTFASLGNADLGILELPFSKEEVFLALSSLGGDQALGLYDFSLPF